jgi:NADH dehydrogenase
LFGARDRFLNVIASLSAWTWPIAWLPGGGRVIMQPLWVEDLVRCLVETLDRADLEGKTVEVAGQERLQYREIVRMVLATAGLKRKPISASLPFSKPWNNLLFSWWRRPPITRFFMDSFTVPDVAPVDTVYQTYGFRPRLMGNQIGYLRGPHLRRRLFQLDNWYTRH